MAKRFKLRFSKVISSFNSCRSKDPSTLPIVPVPSFLRLSPVKRNPITLHLPPPTVPSSKPRYSSSIKRHVSSAFTSIGCGFKSRSSVHHENRTESPPSDHDHLFHWEEHDKWHVVNKLYSEEEDEEETPRRKIYNSSASGHTSDAVLSLPPRNAKRRTRKKKTKPRIRVSTSSADAGLYFSSESFADDVDDEALTETLVSSFESFSTDSSPPKAKNSKRRRLKPRKSFGASSFSPARLSLFQGLIPCVVEGKVRESFAVVKKSKDPYEDFKRSMMEMILEKQMFEEKDLEQLLHCFLSLNSRDHHGVIIEAFYEIWEALFCRRSTGGRVSSVKIRPF
ncbi:transcription repressor OFP7 [Tripterygium wilfordii]|uniref:Transcription repressor n=1 Tax=Tripterygium wilfordii TaxID=458696 RepID=A0A7J7CPM9_TRIWF|nr:transcription repressor OFP7 [Tripterygium wilfordii]KAF5736063.1 transcription repressor OFP7 [Tripterygium wilfordii]